MSICISQNTRDAYKRIWDINMRNADGIEREKMLIKVINLDKVCHPFAISSQRHKTLGIFDCKKTRHNNEY